MRSPLPKRLAALALSTLLALLLAEVLLRWVRPDIGRRGFEDAYLGWASSEYAELDAGGTPDDGRLRVLALGDSYLAGVNVRQMRERFPTYLAEMHPDEVETRILASAGWGPDQELLAFLEKGASWEPDVVVLSFCSNNDLINVMTSRGPGEARKPYFLVDEEDRLGLHDPEGAPLAWGGREPVRRVTRQSYLWDLVRTSLLGAGEEYEGDSVDPRYRLFQGPSVAPLVEEVTELGERLTWAPQSGVNNVNAYLAEDFELNVYQWRLVEAIVRELRDRCEEVGAELVVLVLPTPFRAQDLRLTPGSGYEHRFETPEGPITFRIDEPARRLEEICERLDVALFDPTPEFVERIEREDLVERTWPDPDNRHFSRVGHRLLAAQLADFLQARGLLEGSASGSNR